MPVKTLQVKVFESDLGRLDKFVAQHSNLSRGQVRNLLLYGTVKVNGVVTADAGTNLDANDEVEITFDPSRQYREAPKNPIVVPTSKKPSSSKNFHVVYCDDFLVVVNKAAGLLTVPTDKRESQNLIDLLSRAVNPQRRTKLGLVHRLDRETSGLLVFGQDERSANLLIKQFKDRKPERIYFALVKGKMKDDKGTIRSYLKSDKALNQRSNENGDGELAITHFEVIRELKGASLVKVQLETGRRNQIRVHFSELGHPVLGDQRYSKDLAQHSSWPYKRLALHAAVLGLSHPKTGESLRFEEEIPVEFRRFLNLPAHERIMP